MTSSLIPQKEKTLHAFLIALCAAAAMFVPFLIWDKGYFIFYGDFNVQQIPFYQMAHDAVRRGDIFWSWTTDLGANFIGSYSFYLLGSPFFWVTLPFPSAAVPYLMAPLMVLKLALASLTAYLFLRRFVRPQAAVIGGILYAFSGWSIYNIFFNQFHEAVVYFPLMLLGMERLMSDNKRGLFAVMCFLSALSNYYFFIGQAFFLVIYWVVRAASRGHGEGEWKLTRVFPLALEAVIGTAAAGVFLLPAFYAVIQNSRVDNAVEGWSLLYYGSRPQRFFDIIHSFFFPQDIPARASFFPDSDNKWSSMSAWLPLFGCTGVIAYFQSRRHTDWIKRLILVCVLCALVPILNSMFQLFNAMYYARWFYMMVLILVLATVRCLDEAEETPVNWKRAIGWSGGITLAFTLVIGLTPSTWDIAEAVERGDFKLGLYGDPSLFWIAVAFAAVGLLLMILLVTMIRRGGMPQFFRWTLGVTVGVAFLFGVYSLTAGKVTTNINSRFVTDKALAGAGQFDLPGLADAWNDAPARIDFVPGELDNLGMFWQTPTIQAFHSVVPGSVMEFHTSIGVERSVGSRPDLSHYALRSLTSVRWLFDYDNKTAWMYGKENSANDVSREGSYNPFFDQSAEGDHSSLRMPGWEYHSTQSDFYIYENTCYIPFGFTYDHYQTRDSYDKLGVSYRELSLLKAITLDSSAALRNADILEPLAGGAAYTREAYIQDCADRAATAAKEFRKDNRGFTAVIDLEKENLVFFSVPYEEGWSATVNGETAEIFQANVGFMAVRCPQGADVVIRFDYMTPGLSGGLLLSGGAVLALGAYLLLIWWLRRRSRRPSPFLFSKSSPSTEWKTSTVWKTSTEWKTPAEGRGVPADSIKELKQEMADGEEFPLDQIWDADRHDGAEPPDSPKPPEEPL